MNEQAIIRQIAHFDEKDVKIRLHEVNKMQDHLNAIRNGEVQARKEWVNSSTLIFPEDFTEEMNTLSTDLQSTEKLLKQLDRLCVSVVKHTKFNQRRLDALHKN
jgi:hypothetical protein